MDRVKPKALVFGRSFGLYGHAMALHELGFQICLPHHYRDEIASREEYVSLKESCIYVDEPLLHFRGIELVCCARRPCDNEKIAKELVERGYRGALVLEKPISSSPEKALELASELSQAGLQWDVPYLFIHLEWFDLIQRASSSKNKISIEWTHKAQFTAGHWKTNESEGGGVIAFYLIHILAIFVKLGVPCYLENSKNGRWIIKGEWLEVVFQLSDKASFSLKRFDEILFVQQSPFGAMPKKGNKDSRIPALQRFYTEFLERQVHDGSICFHQLVHERWRDVYK